MFQLQRRHVVSRQVSVRHFLEHGRAGIIDLPAKVDAAFWTSSEIRSLMSSGDVVASISITGLLPRTDRMYDGSSPGLFGCI